MLVLFQLHTGRQLFLSLEAASLNLEILLLRWSTLVHLPFRTMQPFSCVTFLHDLYGVLTAKYAALFLFDVTNWIASFNLASFV